VLLGWPGLNDYLTFAVLQASMDRDADATSHSGSDVSPALHGIPRGAYHRHSGRAGNDDIALRNYLNNYSSSTTSSPTSSADDRTPSPNIFDLLDRRTARDHVTKTNIKRRSEASDSDGEKEVAEISDEKLREDLEIGNVSVELLRRLQGRGVDGEIKLPVIMSSNEVDGDVTNLPPLTLSDESHGNSHIPPSADSANAKNTVEEENDVARSTQDFLDFIAKQADFDRIFCKSSPNDGSDGKLPRAVSIEDWSTYCKLAGVTSPDDYNEDSNKRNTASNEGSGAGDKKNKSDVGSRTLEAAECHGSGVGGIGSVSRKLIMDKIETEKVRSRRRRSGVGAQSPTSRRFDANLTSEEFDELYRLPTEHLHKEKQHGIVERNSRSGVPDRHYRHHHRHHSHDSFHAAGGRHSYTDDDRSYRDVEGACGGTDYYCYDDMSMTHTSGIEFDIESPSSATTSFLRFNDGFGASTRISAAAVDDWNEPPSVGEYHCLRGSSLSANGRDAMSSPESPASPQVTNQTGARPKKSPRKHRAA
jgi:hypothetical protein